MGTQSGADSSWTPTVVSTPGPVWSTPVSTTYSGSVQSMVTTSAQGSYVGGGCDEPCGAKCKVHKLCPFKKHKQKGMIVSDYSPVVLPSGTGRGFLVRGHLQGQEALLPQDLAAPQVGLQGQGLQGVQDVLVLRGAGDDGLVAGPDRLGPVVRRDRSG